MARLPYVEKEGAKPDQAKILNELTQKSGKVANIWKLWAHSPQTLETFMPFYKSVMKGALDPKLRELAYTLASLVNDCPYCAIAHKSSGLRVGVTEEQFREILNYGSSPLFSSTEKIVLQYAEELTRTAKSSEGVFEELKKHLSDAQIVELNLTVGLANFTNRFNMSMMTDLD